MYQAIGSLYDAFRRAVVAFQFEEARLCVLLLKLQDIVDVCPSEGVDALCIVAYHAYIMMLRRELQHYLLLGIVCVLILIHQKVAELCSVLLADFGVFLKEVEGINQQVVKVHGIACTAPLTIDVVYSRHLWHAAVNVA